MSLTDTGVGGPEALQGNRGSAAAGSGAVEVLDEVVVLLQGGVRQRDGRAGPELFPPLDVLRAGRVVAAGECRGHPLPGERHGVGSLAVGGDGDGQQRAAFDQPGRHVDYVAKALGGVLHERHLAIGAGDRGDRVAEFLDGWVGKEGELRRRIRQ